MAFTRNQDDLSVVEKLDTHPNSSGGMSAEAVKQAFDAAAKTLREWINTVHLGELEATGAENIGIRGITGLVGALTVQEALEALYKSQQSMSQGAVADGSIDELKLANSAVTLAKMATGVLAAANVEGLAAVAKSGSYDDLLNKPDFMNREAVQKYLEDWVKTVGYLTEVPNGAVTPEKLAEATKAAFAPAIESGTQAPETLEDGHLFVVYEE